MKKLITIALLITALSVTLNAQSNCVSTAKAVSPVLSEDAREKIAGNLASAIVDYERQASADNLIWVGRRAAYLGEYQEAIQIFTDGIKQFPEDARFYRHRGHQMITIRCFDDAIADFDKAADLIKGKPDAIEPDGIPNAKNTPTSTLQSNIWYHLGLAHYLKGDFEKALIAFRECEKVSKNPDMLVATTNWLFVTLKRLGRDAEAAKTLEPITADLELIENDGYHRMIRMYKGELTPVDLTGSDGDNLTNATMIYGIGNWELINGRTSVAKSYFELVLKTDQWSSFGYIAAETEMNRMD